jgi:hypothetical protein
MLSALGFLLHRLVAPSHAQARLRATSVGRRHRVPREGRFLEVDIKHHLYISPLVLKEDVLFISPLESYTGCPIDMGCWIVIGVSMQVKNLRQSEIRFHTMLSDGVVTGGGVRKQTYLPSRSGAQAGGREP